MCMIEERFSVDKALMHTMLWYCVQCCFVTNIVYHYVIYLLKAHIILEVAVEILMLDNLLPSTVIFLKFCTNFADTVVGIFIIISREIFMLSYVKHIKKNAVVSNLRFISRIHFMLSWSFITLGSAITLNRAF